MRGAPATHLITPASGNGYTGGRGQPPHETQTARQPPLTRAAAGTGRRVTAARRTGYTLMNDSTAGVWGANGGALWRYY